MNDVFNNALVGVLLCLGMLCISFIFVILETSIIALNRPRLRTYSKNAERRVKYILKLADEPEELLSTVQIGITLVNIMLGAFSSNYLEQPIATLLQSFHALDQIFGANLLIISECISVILITFLIVLFEIFSKRIAIAMPEKIAINGVYVMIFFILLFYPLVKLLAFSIQWLLKVFRIHSEKGDISIEEMKFIIQQTEKSGVIDKLGGDMMRRLTHIGHMQVGAIITPRNKIVALDIACTSEENLIKMRNHKYNYYPLINGDYNNLIGVVDAKNLIGEENVTNEMLIDEAKRSRMHYIPQMAHVSSLLYTFKSNGIKFGIVLDEYGAFEGIVTFADIIKAFAGDIASLINKRNPDIIKLSEGYYIVLGNTLIEEVMELMQVTSLPGYEEHEYKTLASFILRHMANVPKVGNKFTAENWRFKIIAMDGMRIDKVTMERIGEASSGEE